jgi:uncharacterized membrane protein YccC
VARDLRSVGRLNLRRLSPHARLSVRAAVCLTTPLVVGLAVGQRAYGTLVALGTLWAVSQDGMDRWRTRAPRLIGVAVAGGSGVAIGSLFVNHVNAWWALVVLFGAVALVAGVIEASLWSTQGMYLLLGVILGGGLRFEDRVWQSGVAIAVGALWLYVVASLTDRRSRRADQQICLSNAYRALADLLSSIGSDAMDQARGRAVLVLDEAQDVVGTQPLLDKSDEVVALHQCFVVALQLGELASYLVSKDEVIDPVVVEALQRVGAVIRVHSALEATVELTDYAATFASTLASPSSRYIAASFRIPDTSTLVAAPPFRSTISRLPFVERLRFAALLSSAIVFATLLSRALEGPRGYWLPMSVAFIFRPDLGPVMRRAVARTIGTLAGVGIAALAALWGNPEILLIVLCCAMAAAVPWASRRSHALTVMVFTPIVFVFVGVLGPDQNLFGPRIVDTALGAAIVLFVDYVLWLHAPSLRPVQQVNRARQATINYENATTESDPVTRHSLRRNALRAVTRARSAITLASVEPHLLHESDPALLAQLEDLVTAIDVHTESLIETARRT